MRKVLVVVNVEGEVAIVFHDYQSDKFEILSIKNMDRLEEVISKYSPDVIVSRENSTPSSIPLLLSNVVSAKRHKELEKLIINGSTTILGLERNAENIYPTYYFLGNKLTKAQRWALYALWLFEPWGDGETIQEKKGFNEFVEAKEDLTLEQKEKIFNSMNEKTKELIKNISEASKFSYLSNLSSKEIALLLESTKTFSKVLEQFYPLKKEEETKIPLSFDYAKENEESEQQNVKNNNKDDGNEINK